MIARALNQKTARHHDFAAFLDLAQSLGCVGVEARNDLGRPLFDGIDPNIAGRMARDRGLRLLGLSEIYPFNDWSDARAAQVQALVAAAHASGAETISLIPRVDGRDTDPATAGRVLHDVMTCIAPLLDGTRIIALIEPIGFQTSSLRYKADLVTELQDHPHGARFAVLHDTFQHALAGETEIFAAQTRLVHVSGIADAEAGLTDGDDSRRSVIGQRDCCDSVDQIVALRRAGYDGPISFECTDGDLQRDPTIEARLRQSFDLVDTACEQIFFRRV